MANPHFFLSHAMVLWPVKNECLTGCLGLRLIRAKPIDTNRPIEKAVAPKANNII
jgi:hypothetical protein